MSTRTPGGPLPWSQVPRTWLPDAALGGAVALLGLVEASNRGYDFNSFVGFLFIALAMAVAAGLHRLSPGAALGLVWFAGAVQLFAGLRLTDAVLTPMFVELAAAIVAYGAARYGSTSVVWTSGLSIPVGAGLAFLYLLRFGFGSVRYYGISDLASILVDRNPLVFLLPIVGLLTLSLSWLLGLALRSRDNARRSREDQVAAETDRSRAEVERAQAEELAVLRDRQNKLARDVHDVVGHSLAVILAQAESAQYLPEGDTAKVRTTMANIADSARQSLRDVREVLSPQPATTAVPGGLDSLLDGVRSAGNDLRSTVVGTPQPLPPELDVVAFRVLQEMLTNALKHGRRGEPVDVERHWEGELRIEVRNVIAATTEDTMPIQVALANGTATSGGGLGVDGMRRRLESVGGRLDVRRREEPGIGQTFTATAWVPLRTRA